MKNRYTFPTSIINTSNSSLLKCFLFIVFVLSFELLSAQCTEPYDTGDCDGDGVQNSVDEDDDNDGILDSVECTAGGGSGSIVAVSQTVNGMDNLPVTIDGLNCFTSPNEIDFNLTPFAFNSGALVSNVTVYVKFDKLDLDGGCSGSPNRSFPNELAIKLISAQGTEITLIDYGDYSSSGNTFSDIEIVFDDAAVNGFVGSSPASGTFRPKESLNNLNGEIANGSWTVTAGDDFLEDPLVIEDFSITVTVQETDTDGDGIPNCLDLDSDNDGIYDVFEAGGTDANNDGRADDDDNNGDNTASNGIPTSAGTGITPTETTTGTPNYINLDSDGDGCFDANEAYNSDNADFKANPTDSNGDGTYGGVITSAEVNTFGVISGVTYNASQYDDVIDNTTNVCQSDTDGDGVFDNSDLDNDNDGILDSAENSCGTNLTQLSGVTASSSSVVSGGVASRVLDNNTNGQYSAGSSAHTNGGNPYEWIDVDLGVDQKVYNLLIWNRTDSCCDERLSNAYVLVSRNPFPASTTDISASLANADKVFQVGANANGLASYEAIVNDTIRYIRVQHSNDAVSNSTLQVAEIQAFALCDTDGDGTANIYDYDSDNDGCPDAIEAAGAFTSDDLTADDNLANDPSGVDSDGVPNIVGSPQANATTVTKATQATLNTEPTNQWTSSGNNAAFVTAASAIGTTSFNAGAPDYTIPPATNEDVGLRYQWQEDSGSGFTDISDGGIYSGATTANLVLTAVTTAMNGNDYKIIVTHIDNDCILLESTVVELTVFEAINDMATTDEDEAITIAITSNDLNKPTSGSLNLTSGPSNGTVTVNDGGTPNDPSDDTVTYTPSADFNGTDTFNYEICDTASPANCSPATVSVTVTPTPDAADDTATTFEDVSVTVDVLDNDNDIPTMGEINITTAPSNGTVTINDGGTPTDPSDDTVIYVPNTDYKGSDSFDYEICDGATPANCSTATVDVSVLPTPDALGDVATTTEDKPVTIDVLDNDSDIPSMGTIDITTAPSNGTVTINDGGTPNDPSDDVVVYTPNSGYTGNDTFEYEICDAANPANCSSAEVSLNVEADFDGDGVIDIADLDDDNDGILDNVESQGNSPSGDEDGDGIPNWRDTTDNGDSGDGSTTDYTDADLDGIPDIYDFDGDGIPNHFDLDADNDGIYDVIETGGTDINGDGRADDDDNNANNTATYGIPTSAGTGITNPTDTGNNNSPNYLNIDSDGDGCFDAIEAGFLDENKDGALGDAPITVDTSGVVTSSAGYSAPTETNSGTADYVDKAVNSCAGIAITKTATLVDVNSNGIDDVGDRIDYTFTVTNTGTVDLTDVKVTDALATVTPSTGISLAAQAVDNSTFTASYVIQQSDVNNGTYSNTAAVSAKTPSSNTISDNSDDPTNATNVDPDNDGNPDDATVVYFDQEPSVSLLKTGMLEDANSDGFPNEGEKIRYSFTVQNTGNVSLTGITITDPLVAISGGPIDLEPGVTDTSTFFALYTLTQADIDSRSITNAAVVTGKDPNNADISDNSDDPANATNVDDNGDGDPDDDTVIALAKNAEIEIFKTGAFVDSNTDGVGQIGETIGYIFDVYNRGNVTINNITITDPLGNVVGGPISLAPGASDNTSFTFSYPLDQDDIDTGEVINRATVIGSDPDNVAVTDDSDDPTTAVAQDATVVELTTDPKIALFKTSVFNDENGNTFADIGETITYTFDVRNVGNVTLNNIMVSDPKVTVTGGPISLAPADFDNTTFSATYTLTQDDIDEGTIENQAEVTSEDSTGNVVEDVSDFSDDPNNPNNVDLDKDGDPDDPTVTDLPGNPALSLEKTGVFNDENNDGLAQVNETMSYTFRIENTGNVTLTGVTVTDPNAVMSGGPIATILPGAVDTDTFTATHTITQADIDAGEVSNLATVSATTPDSQIISDDSDDPNEPLNTDNNNDGDPDDPTVTTAPQNSNVALTKAVTGGTFNELGDVITYTMVVTNTGNTTLTNLVVTDTNATITNGSPITTLAPGASANVTATHTITIADVIAESFTNIATVSGEDPQGNALTGISDDPNNATDVDTNGDGDPDDPTVILLDTDGDGIPNQDDLDDDNDGITDVEEENGDITLDTDMDGTPDRLDIDADGDGILDVVEAGHGIADTDGDGRLDGPVGTDGIPDSVQDNSDSGTINYAPEDTDGDGIDDFQDIDDDGDGVPTSTEINDGTDPLDECDLQFRNISLVPEASWNNADCDGDGVTNGNELLDGTSPTNACDSDIDNITEPVTTNSLDCDGDGVPNAEEIANGTNPEDPCDFVLANATETPNQEWSDSDCDGDGATNGQEIIDGTNPLDLCDFEYENITVSTSDAWNDEDCDGDMVLNGQELADGTDPSNDCDNTNGEPLEDSDCDEDGLTNAEEASLGTDPNKADTDGDQIPDGQEFLDNTSPLDPCESNGGTPPDASPCGLEIENDLMTPDGDGINDNFRIKNIEQYPDNTVEIFNRWGVKVYSTTGYDNAGNSFIGISNGRVTIKANETLPAGVYYYIINYNDGGVTESMTGYLYINQ
jgi:gliding motility-associated-like protein/uncharacterized repeat protein (TIGR01451 family)